ncbi:MAG: tRNA 5-methoxyuridine(34)/uridine 5-oxyacetic acid(34) synthase CmoB [Chloroflexi bacterium]|nr:tRNA 5-methoxyuridine(34)/uridine 5-oxyacetic acid(34) synthase CmoB [Chloroflexota bacterium]
MIVYDELYEQLVRTPLAGWLETLPQTVEAMLQPETHGKLPEWLAAVAALPQVRPSTVNLETAVSIGTANDLTSTQHQQLAAQLRLLHPWRKGSFDLFGIHIDTEWRSDWKWDRLKGGIGDLNGRLVLDVGCGNGYHMWRMVGAGAKLVIGLDPFLVYVMQYQAMRHFLRDVPAYVLPLGIEALPPQLKTFDTVFSMGVLYHRRSPIDHLLTLQDALRSGGELVLETLVIEGRLGEVLVPEGRYAQMRNVWFIPSAETLMVWLRKCKFQNVQLVDVTPTTTDEQRSTGWMTFQSLTNFLDPTDKTKTIEGYPAPMRAVITAVAP